MRNRQGMDRGGVGNPHEEAFFFEGFRDYGQNDPREESVVFDPADCGPARVSPEQKALLDEAQCRIEKGLKKAVFISKRPAFVEPPFFSKPLTKTKGITIGPGGAQGQLINRPIADRQRAVVSAIGVDVSDPTAYNAQSLVFWFALTDASRAIIPVFEDQTIGLAFAPTGLPTGQTTIFPGTTENPYSLLQSGIAFQVKGPQNLILQAQNFSAAPVLFRTVVSLYQYWLPQADAYATADLQL